MDPTEKGLIETKNFEDAERQFTRTTIAYNGSIMESYPGYKGMCQEYIDVLVKESLKEGVVREDAGKTASTKRSAIGIDLVPASEGSLLGAAVALASACEQESAVDT